jgi:adenine-specific DNA-methyltransferase
MSFMYSAARAERPALARHGQICASSSATLPAAALAAGEAPDLAVGEREQRRANGVFYTPPRLARALADWALKDNPKRILEPSFGAGVFLEAALGTLERAGVRDPASRLYGVEIDSVAPARLREATPALAASRLQHADLLSLEPEHLGGTFHAVLGNPPYIRHHRLSEEQIARGRQAALGLGVELNGRSDAWAYFCAHLVRFLAPKGRLALVLPGSVLEAEYARPLLDALAAEEGEVQLIRIGERIFPGVQERTVLLLLDRSRPSGATVAYRRIGRLDGLGAALRRAPRRAGSRRVGKRRSDGADPSWRLTTAERKVWATLCSTCGVVRLEELAQVRIGVVTGANEFFVRSQAAAEALGDGVESVPIISRGGWLKTPRWTERAQAQMAQAPSRLLLFAAEKARLSERARSELRRGERLGLRERSHCRRRSPWWAITDIAAPELLLGYMGSHTPRLVLNEAGATSTNAIHRVNLLPAAKVSPEVLVGASWTTLYRLSAELYGRSYGGGVLKLEPNGATQLRLPAILVPGLLQELDEAFRAHGLDAARRLADRRILTDRLGVGEQELAVLARASKRLEALRRA